MTDVAKELAERIVGKVQFYVTEERAFAPGIADGWPEVIQAPHTANGRLRKVLTADIVKEIASALEPQWVSVGASRIALERQRQVESEGWTPEHDDEHSEGEMALAAACYATPQPIRADVERYVPCGCREACCHHLGGEIARKGWQDPWPWAEEWDKREKHGRIRQLEIAGALIAAEIERLIRIAPTEQNERAEEKTNG